MNIKTILRLQQECLLYIYDSMFPEVLLIFPKFDSNNKYYFDMLIAINKGYDVNAFVNVCSELIQVIDYQIIDESTISYK